MRSLFLSLIVALLAVFSASASLAQPPALAVPTTRILAIGSINAGVAPDQVKAILPQEVRDTVRLYLDGKIDQWFAQQDHMGVVFILNMTDLDAAHELLEKLPLGQAHLMSFQLMRLGPLSPLRYLPGLSAAAP